MTGQIVTATERDGPAISALIAKCEADAPWLAPRKDEADIGPLLLRATEVDLIRDSAGLAGVMAVQQDEIQALYVRSDLRGTGLGSQLVSQRQAMHRVLGAWVYEADENALRFYLNQGFEVTGRGAGNDAGLPELRLFWRAP